MWYRLSKTVQSAKSGIKLNGLEYELFQVIKTALDKSGYNNYDYRRNEIDQTTLEQLPKQGNDYIDSIEPNDPQKDEWNQSVKNTVYDNQVADRQWQTEQERKKRHAEGWINAYLAQRTDIFKNPPTFKFENTIDDTTNKAALGSYELPVNKYGGVIRINPSLLSNAKQALETIAHELSHALEMDKGGRINRTHGHDYKDSDSDSGKAKSYRKYMNEQTEIYSRVQNILQEITYNMSEMVRRGDMSPEDAIVAILKERNGFQDGVPKFINYLNRTTDFKHHRSYYTPENNQLAAKLIYNAVFNTDFLNKLPERITQINEGKWFGTNGQGTIFKYKPQQHGREWEYEDDEGNEVPMPEAHAQAATIARDIVDKITETLDAVNKNTEQKSEQETAVAEAKYEEAQRQYESAINNNEQVDYPEDPIEDDSSFQEIKLRLFRATRDLQSAKAGSLTDPRYLKLVDTLTQNVAKLNGTFSWKRKIVDSYLEPAEKLLNEYISATLTDIGVISFKVKFVTKFSSNNALSSMVFFGSLPFIFDTNTRVMWITFTSADMDWSEDMYEQIFTWIEKSLSIG